MTSATVDAAPSPHLKYDPWQSRWSPHNRAVVEQQRSTRRQRTEAKRDQRRAERTAARAAALASCDTPEVLGRRTTAFADAAALAALMSPATRRVPLGH